ncbi:MAG: IS1595 family transposase [Bacteroidota bacterium]
MIKPKEILAQFKLLPVTEQSDILNSLRVEFEGKGKLLEVVSSSLITKKDCPYCGSVKVHKRGKQSGVQMYKCVDCAKWFSSTTGTPLWDIKKKDKWQSYLNCMQRNVSIKKAALEVGICIQTSFDWRHKILSVLNKEVPLKLTGRVECDELELPLSNKGERNLTRKPRKRSSDFKRNLGTKEIRTVQVVTAIDEHNQTYFKAIETKRITSNDLKKTIGKKLDKNVTLVTDKHPSYIPFAKSKRGIKHKTVKSTEYVNKEDKKVNLQKVNNQHMQLRQFLGKFNGVSSKYLQNYLNWFAYGKNMESIANQTKQWFIAILTNDIAYNLYQLIKNNVVNIRT